MENETDHRSLAVGLFNRTWELLEMPARSAAEDEDMIHSAHASRFHWSQVGTARNLAIGDWQVSRVYAVLGRHEGALYHAERSLLRCHDHHLDPFVTGYAHEALARAHAVGGNSAETARHRDVALELAGLVEDEADRDLLIADLAV